MSDDACEVTGHPASVCNCPLHRTSLRAFEIEVEIARQSYTDLVFRWLAACRDFPYAQHPQPSSNLLALWTRQEIIGTCAREFVRSNTGFICPHLHP